MLSVLLFKDFCVLAFFIGSRVVPVSGYFVDKEQREDLHSFIEELHLLVKVRLDRLTDLNTAQRYLGNITSRITHRQLYAIGKAQGVRIGIYVRYHKPIAVLIQLVRYHKQIVTFAQLAGDALDVATAEFLFELHNRDWRFFV